MAVVLWLGTTGPQLMAASPSPTPAPSQPAAGKEDFGQYLADHEADLAPFFSSHNAELVKEAIPFFFAVMGNVILLNLIIGWIIDVAAGRGFSIFYAPTHAKIKPAIIYGTARLVLIVALTIAGSLAGVFISFLHSTAAIGIFLGFLFLVDFVLEVVLVCIVYGTSPIVAALFFIGLLTIHFILGIVLTGPLVQMRVVTLVTQFIDQKITPQVKDAASEAKHDLAAASSARDEVKAKTTNFQNRLTEAQAEQDRVRKEIDQKKNSEAYVFSRIAQVRAQGNGMAAHDQLVAFIAQFPNGALTESARTQLAQVSSDLALQEAQKKQAEADAAHAVAQARADLQARAAKGEATLSDMREALIGRTRKDVKALFGDPTDIASDRWGYSQQMVVNPLTNERHGLAIYFLEGTVQSVDFYYGKGGLR